MAIKILNNLPKDIKNKTKETIFTKKFNIQKVPVLI